MGIRLSSVPVARVLLLEDEPNIARIIEFKLAREGHEVCLGDAPGFAPDLALVDADVEGDLRALVEELRHRCAVVVLTDSRDEDTPARAVAAGAVATVRKPFKPTVLARLVRELTTGRRNDRVDIT